MIYETPKQSQGKLPGEDFDERGDIRPFLEKHRWTFKGHGNDGRERWARPGKGKGHSATLTDGKIFYPFSSNSHPFEACKAYSPFGVYAYLEHGGDFSAASKALAAQGYGAKAIQEKPKAIGRTLADLQKEYSKDIEWLWRSHIPKALPIIIDGREGEGKTSICLVAAREILQEHPEGIVVWLACEGMLQDTINKAATLNVDNEDRFLLAQKADGSFKFDFTRSQDLHALDSFLNEIQKPVLAVFIDSIRGMRGKYGDNDSETGNVMHHVNGIVCDKYKASLIYLDHHGKSEKVHLRDRNVGSTAKVAAVRMFLSVLPRSKYTRRIQVAKCNIFTEVPELLSIQVGPNIQLEEETNDSEETKSEKAEKFLLDMLEKQPRIEVSELKEKVKVLELFSWETLEKVKQRLGVKSERENPPHGTWFWVSPVERSPSIPPIRLIEDKSLKPLHGNRRNEYTENSRNENTPNTRNRRNTRIPEVITPPIKLLIISTKWKLRTEKKVCAL